jgi:CHAD domain-containing protein
MSTNAKWIEGLAPESSVEDAARRSLEPRLTAVAHHLPMAAHLAEHDIEHVHRLRVATRRATAALKLYRDCVSLKRYQWMNKRLRKIRRAAGDARDLDVLTERLEREYGDPVVPIIELINRDRAAIQPAIQHVAERCRADDRFIRKTAQLLQGVHWLKSDSAVSQTAPFREFAAEQFTKVAERFETAMPNESSDPPALHQFRIRAKDLRYAIELVAPAFGAELRKKLYALIEELQERLGRIQDHVAAIERCSNWSTGTHGEALRETLNELSDAEKRGQIDSIQDFHNWWNEERKSRVRELLKLPANAEPIPPLAHQT